MDYGLSLCVYDKDISFVEDLDLAEAEFQIIIACFHVGIYHAGSEVILEFIPLPFGSAEMKVHSVKNQADGRVQILHDHVLNAVPYDKIISGEKYYCGEP